MTIFPVPEGSEERQLGIDFFLTGQEGFGGRLRREAGDFRVREVSEMPDEGFGEMTAAIITSKNWETNRLVRTLARNLRISRTKVFFAGTKDKRAVTTQLFVIHAPLRDIEALAIPDVTIERAYPTARRIDIGDLYGNAFEIRITEIDDLQAAEASANEVSRIVSELGGFINYFGVQRFGAVRPITHKIGRFIVEGRFREAVECYLWDCPEKEREEVRLAREMLRRSGDYSEALREFPKTMGFEKAMLNHLVVNNDDWVGALSVLPRNLLMMFIHAYQSYIFNRTLSARLAAGLPLDTPVEGDVLLKLDRFGLPDHNEHVIAEAHNLNKLAMLVKRGKAFVSAPLLGHESEFAKGQVGEIERKTFEAEGLGLDAFIIPHLEKMSSKGTRREVLAPVRDLTSGIDGDALKLTFELNKGCYATSLLREYMKADSLLAY